MAEKRRSTAKSQHTKATRQDWIDVAVASLNDERIDQLRVLHLAGRLGVSRSSFYWYFESPDELRSELLTLWEHNTTSIVERSQRATQTVVEAVLGVFECWADRRLYSSALDLAVRDWGRRDEKIAARVADADHVRLDALTEMFARHGFAPPEALVRARLLYHSQVGYYALGTTEPLSDRMISLPYYLEAMAGARPTATELATFTKVAEAAQDMNEDTPQ